MERCKGGPVNTRKCFSILAACLFSAAMHPVYAQCNTVDAVTTASFRITGGEACSTYANLSWTFSKRNGTMTIQWGTSTNYDSSKSVYTSNPIKLTGLKPDTKYFYHVYGVYQNKTHQYTTSSFTTSPGPVTTGTRVTGPAGTANKGSLTVGSTRISFPMSTDQPIEGALYSAAGVRIMRFSFPTAGTNSIRNPTPGMASGVYLLQIRNRHQSHVYTINLH